MPQITVAIAATLSQGEGTIKQNVVRRERKTDGAEVTSAGRPFQTTAPATGNDRQPSVARRADRTSRRDVSAERSPRRPRPGRLVVD